MRPITVLLAEDHVLVRAGIRSLLQKMAGIEVVAEAGDGREALRLVKKHNPQVVLMDITMPELNGLEATAKITKGFPNVSVIILSMHDSEEYVRRALRNGAKGYLLKDAVAIELRLAIQAVAHGYAYLSPPVSRQVVAEYVRQMSNETSHYDQLTPRQREVLQLIAEGRTTRQIAETLSLTIKTVESHRSHLMERLNIHDIATLVRYAIQMGLVVPGE